MGRGPVGVGDRVQGGGGEAVSGREDVNEAGRAVIAACVMRPGQVLPMAVDAGVDEGWFEEAECRAAWRGLRGMFDARQLEGIDALTLRDRLGGGAPPLAWFERIVDETPTAAHAEHYLAILRERVTLGRCRGLAREFVRSLESVGAQNALAAFASKLAAAADTGRADDDAGAALEGVVAGWREAHRIRIVEGRMDYCPGVPAAWPDLTAMYNGLQPGLHVVAARPSTGKTALMVNLVRFWCESGLKVGFNSLDMQPGQLFKRFVAELARVSLPKAEFGTTSRRDLERLEGAAAAVRGWPLRVCVRRDLDALRAWAVTRRMKGELDVLVVDFLQLMQFEGCWRMGVDDRVGRISGTLKAIGNDLGIPVVALSQLNRQCEEDGGREPQLSDLRGSGSIEQDAFTVLFLHADRPLMELWRQVPPVQFAPGGLAESARQYLASSLRPVWLMLKKNQNGRTGNLPFVFFPSYFLFMLGDAAAQPWYDEEDKRRRPKPNFAPLFAKVARDWRGDALEDELEKNGALVAEAEAEVRGHEKEGE